MAPIHLKAKVGPDGVLNLKVPLGVEWANLDVDVLVTPVKPAMTREEWHKFIAETAGSWRGDLERVEDKIP
jgi:hypothetical protein